MNANNELSIDWYRTPIDPELLQTLNRRDNLKALVLTAAHLGLIVLTGCSALLALKYLTWPWLLLALLLHGFVTKFSINAVHEFVHGTVFKTSWLNVVFAYVYGFIGWIHPYYFWDSHTEHHKYTMHPPHDLEVVAPSALNFKHFLLNTFFDPYMLYYPLRGNVLYALGKFSSEGWEGHLLQQQHRKRKIAIWARVLLAGHATIAGVSLYYGYWLIPILTSLTPAYGGLLLYLCNTLQHTGLPGEVSDFRLSCRTVRLNPVLEFLYWRMNYHTEHHMYAAVPCYNLRKLHEAVKHDLPPTHNGLVSAWLEVIGIMHRLKEDPDFRYFRKLPGPPGEVTSDSSDSEVIANSPDTNAAAESDTASAADNAEQAEKHSDRIAADSEVAARVWECSVCGFIYSEALGLPDEGIAPGTAWDDIPDDWMCPDCGVSKADFQMLPV